MYNATIISVRPYAYANVREHACACVTIVVHTDMYAVTGILRNMQVFNYLLGTLKTDYMYMCNTTML